MFIIPDNPRLTLGKSKTVKRREQRQRQSMRNMTATEINKTMSYAMAYSAGPCMLAAMTAEAPKKCPVNKMENTMYVDYVSSDKHQESAKTNYLLQRALNTKQKLRDALYVQFGLRDDDAPANPIELVARVKAGQYVLPTEKEASLMVSMCFYGNVSALTGIKWRNPTVIEDRAGYKTADAELETAFQAVQDSCMIDSPDAALVAIQTFEKWVTTVVPATVAA